jgi:hypothetical protein
LRITEWLPVMPIAQHWLAVAHETLSRNVMLLGTDAAVQWVPPSTVTTAQQLAVGGHETLNSCDGWLRMCCVNQVRPPSTVATIALPRPLLPTAQQLDEVGQAMLMRDGLPLGRVCALHVTPPSLLATTAPPR